ncbi:TPA: hypothetical protein CPT90_06705 [Candidatus Gastranaerophilales bacterium HUM_3]|nr:MAG TPA: hypothetical protein CPT90_06705 [Candidatus Gastranaerophilales bacterium HUM_3]DAA86598.1 MAG TPA: hypothetical protein CPT99_07140 [Candidatus Gastranaerophilales bacterium HUM_4]DAA92911.1 MAG TPA: hypothetical protein CPT87_00975 [Candidatus Gastranaerophilales bacterium HUM_5]
MENLKEKERTIEELALFMRNKTDEKQSLYCMLLGAGASKSSGIRTGQDLVNGWRDLFYKKIADNSDSATLDEKKALLKERFTWYKPENEYSSFFGKIYDLPNQRRNFIELEVNDKEPSIGYHYLNKLAENGEIETFFTTNFDDLLEQAFAYSKKRPIVCPHDSSVKNISITSRRTKIIKLHGDFLFNTLQSTEDETQNLNDNMKNKFEEFLKNYGLIVLGYAGFDNSIMDVLLELVAKSDYLNNGIYWCIKKEDFHKEKLSPKLKKLLDTKKVYYILIDNFDSFCAKLTHLVLEKETISLGDMHQSKLTSRQKFFIEQKEKFSNDTYILNDINECLSSAPFTDSNNYEIEKDLSLTKDNFKITKDNAVEDLKTPEEVQIYELIKNKEYDKAIETIDIKVNEKILSSYQYNRYVKLKIQCYLKLKQRNRALNLIDELIKYNEEHKKDSNIPLLIQKAGIVPIDSEKVQILEKALSLDCNNIDIINFLAEAKTSLINHNPNLYKSIVDDYNRSINLQPISTNDAYIDKLNFIKHYTSEDKQNKISETCNQIIQDLVQKDYYSIAIYDAKIELLYQEAKNNSNKEFIIEQFKSLFEEYYNGNSLYERNELYLQEYIRKMSKLKYDDELKNIFNKYDLDNKFNIAYQIQKAEVMLSNFHNLNESIKVLENIDKSLIITKNKWRKKYYINYLDYLLYNKEYDKICRIVDNEPDSKILANINAYKEALLIKDNSKYFDIIYKDFEESEKLTSDYITLTYSFLKLEMYDEIYNTCQKLFDNQTQNNNVDINNDILRINYNLAKKNLNKTITKSNLEHIFNHKDDSVEKAAAYVLIDKMDEATKIITNKINKDYYYFYYLQLMPVFKNINFEKMKLQEKEFSK